MTTSQDRAAGAGEPPSILDTLDEVVYQVDSDGRISYLNQVAGEVLDIDPEELLGRPFEELFHPADAAAAASRLRQVLAGTARGPIEARMRHQIDEQRWIRLSCTPFTVGGAVRGARGILTDITVRRAAERALADTGRRYRALFEGAHDGVLVIRNYEFVECNHAAERIFQRPMTDIVGHTPWQLSPKMQLDGTSSETRGRALIDRALVEGTPLRFDWVHTRGDGMPIVVEVSLSRVRVGDEWLLQVLHRDITERVEARETERKRLHQLAVIGQVAHAVASLLEVDAVLRTAVDEVHVSFEYDSVVILLLDPEAARLDLSAIAGRYAAMIPADFSQRVGEGLIGAAARELQPVLVHDVRRDPRFVAAVPAMQQTAAELAVPILLGHRVLGVLDVQDTNVGAFDEIDVKTLQTVASLIAASLHNAELFERLQEELAERRRTEEELRHAQKMEALGRLAGGIAHDFNNLLQAVQSTLELLRLELADDHHTLPAIDEVLQHVNRGASLARQLLLFARRGVTRPERLVLENFIAESAGFLRRLVRSNIAIECEPAARGLPVSADRGQLEQVLTNLVVNAADAMPGGGRIVLRSGSDSPDTVFLEVADSGTGMPSEVLGKVFEPFFTTKATDRGTGLGLSVVHGIVTAHGGTIEVVSELGAGSCFRITLPHHDSGAFPPVVAHAGPAAGLNAGRGERVLLVEDDPGIRDVLSDLLTRLGYRVSAAGTAEEAVRLSPEQPFELLLTDVMLPGALGTELAAQLVTRWPDLAVIVMSGYAPDDRLRHDVGTGRVRFLQKPVKLETLSREVREALDARCQSTTATAAPTGGPQPS